MMQNKVTAAERNVLKLMAQVGTYINTGDRRRPMCSIGRKGIPGIVHQFHPSTHRSLILKGLLHNNEITKAGGEAAVKGYYTTPDKEAGQDATERTDSNA